ncbi:MAG TPA: serine/threonine-protein kinase [Thermoanaerobaculia bacterium]|jgi:serine/threonine-protein kinase
MSSDPEKTFVMGSDDSRPRRRSDEQFAPGTIVAGRYRIGSILGAGGMGEVYRADDTKLGQTVALKFLPARLERDPVLLGRLHDEVRLGRQIAHPNVCHLYDIVEADGAHFVAMEYVDGEDLSRLLPRIGRLAPDKAVDFARGIAAGLAAAHAKGILHRDLKPANIMIDSRGDARIMDFGLALAAGEDDGTISGTAAYMAPEQLEGRPATVRSDLYALGLVMYELFTGKRAHAARTLTERVRDAATEIATPSSHIRDMDPAVERIILRCLAVDPEQRPASAREIILALPGSDPLAAAMAAGETPSPRVVAAAGAEGTLTRWQAWTMLGAVAVLVVAHTSLRVRTAPALPTSAEVLWARSATILETLGIPARGEPIRQPHVVDGPAPHRFRSEYGVSPAVSRVIPFEANAPGWTTIEVDSRGRLARLLTAPDAEWKPKPLDWRPLLEAAGVDAASLRPVAPRIAPTAPFDARAAWVGMYEKERVGVRIEAAAWKGTPVAFGVSAPNDGPVTPSGFGSQSATRFISAVGLIALAVALLLAARNVRARRVDRQGALRMSVALFAVAAAGQFFDAAARAGALAALSDLSHIFGAATDVTLYVLVSYLAVEPWVRRRWPELLISWARLADGRPRDPLVARHVMIGILAGVAHAILSATARPIAAALDGGSAEFREFRIGNLWDALAAVHFGATGAIASTAMPVVALVVFTIVLRRRALAGAALFTVLLTFFWLAVGQRPASVPSYVVIAGLLSFITVRYGLVALSVAQATFFALFMSPLLPGAGWATATAPVALAVVVALALWAFHTSLGGQPMFSATLLDD